MTRTPGGMRPDPRPDAEPLLGRLVDLPTTDIDRAGAPPAETVTRSRSGRDYVGRSGADDEAADFGRVGGRRKLRGDAVAVAIGLIFVLTAVTKPWSLGQSPAAAGPTGRNVALVAGRTGTPAPAPARGGSAQGVTGPAAPGGNFGSGFADGSVDPTNVDWGLLTAADAHTGWGIAIATPPAFVEAAAGTVVAAHTTWTPLSIDATTGSLTATIQVPSGRDAYAIAVTWPGTVKATSIVFGYVSAAEPANPAEQDPAVQSPAHGIAPMTGPAEVVTVLTALSSWFVSVSGPAHSLNTAAVSSGEFWVAPDSAGGLEAPESVASAWRSEPWSWPPGRYSVTVITSGGPEEVAMTLQQTLG